MSINHLTLALAVDILHGAWTVAVILLSLASLAAALRPRGKLHRLQIAMITIMILAQVSCGGCPLTELSARLRGSYGGTFLAPLLARWLGVPVPEVVITLLTLSALIGSLLSWGLWRTSDKDEAQEIADGNEAVADARSLSH